MVDWGKREVVFVKLNPDCVRDILLTVEDTTDLQRGILYPGESTYPRLEKYDTNEVLYHIEQCRLSGFLVGCKDFNDFVTIRYLSPAGHEFLSSIRRPSIWDRVVDISQKIGVTSLTALSQIAKEVVAELIKSQFRFFP